MIQGVFQGVLQGHADSDSPDIITQLHVTGHSLHQIHERTEEFDVVVEYDCGVMDRQPLDRVLLEVTCDRQRSPGLGTDRR